MDDNKTRDDEPQPAASETDAAPEQLKDLAIKEPDGAAVKGGVPKIIGR